jgi:hypothetical protein
MTAYKKQAQITISQVKELWSNSYYRYSCIFISLLSFITLLLHPTVGIDDTSFSIYFVDGVAPAAGRWCLYLIQKIIPLSYNPYVIEFLGILIWNLSVSIWCAIFRQISNSSGSIWGFTLFSCIMISSPILSEILVWYLHNGIFIGYGLTALAVIVLLPTMKAPDQRRYTWIGVMMSSLLLTIALGFYESFMIVFLMGALMVFIMMQLKSGRSYGNNLRALLVKLFVCSVVGLLLRSLIIQLIIWIFHLENQVGILESRGLHEFFGWFSPDKGLIALFKVMREFFINYYIDAAVYLPITVTVLAIAILIIVGINYSIRLQSGSILLCTAAIVLLPWAMPLLEGAATPYRSSQYIPLLCGFAALLFYREIQAIAHKKVLKYAGILFALFILYRQTYELNKWFYFDALKYEDAKQTMEAVSLKIASSCDVGKPVCVIGNYPIPQGLIQTAYSPHWSKRTKIAKFFIVGFFGEDVWDDYETPNGYAIAETPFLSVIEWGSYAFKRLDNELAKFCNMHGITMTADDNPEHYQLARLNKADSPSWPQDGSIIEQEDHIIVNFGNF